MNQPSLRIAFAGTPDFAVPSLQAMIESPFEVVAVLTQPDRPKGRGRALQMSPVKALATKAGIPVLQPTSLRDITVQQSLRALMVDVIVVVAYGLLLPPAVLTLPRYGCINVHASILPRYRGASPIVHALLAGDESTGVSIMAMDEGLDTGPVYAKVHCPIEPDRNAITLTEKLSHLGTHTLLSVLDGMAQGKPRTPKAQASQGVSLAPKVKKTDAKLDWTQDARTLERHVRAYALWPVAFAHLDDEPIKIHQAKALPMDDNVNSVAPGTVISTSAQGIDVMTANGVLRLLRVQWPGGKAMLAQDCWHQARFSGDEKIFS